MKIHPAANLFPMLPDDELHALAEDIKANGLQHPIVMFGDQLLDGRNPAADPQEEQHYYATKLESGLRYQDFVSEVFHRQVGITIMTFASQKYQYERGENLCGFEIKHDEEFKNTGNLWIERYEKRRRNNPAWIPSGILRPNNSWIYVIGYYQTIFVFPINLLRLLFESGRYKERENKRGTSLGFFLPSDHAHRYAAKIINPSENTKP